MSEPTDIEQDMGPYRPEDDPSNPSNDIVTRLRNYNTCTDSDIDEAANEIEQLREGIEGMKEGMAVRIADLEAEIVRLTAERDEWRRRAIQNNPGTVDGGKAYMKACEGGVVNSDPETSLKNYDWPCCWKCTPDYQLMLLCPTCGNKRCPHASDHDLACTGSNAAGQTGSIYDGDLYKFKIPKKEIGE